MVKTREERLNEGGVDLVAESEKETKAAADKVRQNKLNVALKKLEARDKGQNVDISESEMALLKDFKHEQASKKNAQIRAETKEIGERLSKQYPGERRQ